MTLQPLTGRALRALDEALLGLVTVGDVSADGDLRAWSLEVVPHLCRTDGRFYGGAALAAALACGEAAAGRPALWSSTQLVSSADLGDRIDITAAVVATGRSIAQVQVRGEVDGRLVFSSVGSCAEPREGGLAGAGQVMPSVPPPDDCERWRGPGALRGEDGEIPMAAPTVGHHLVSEHRDAPLLQPSADHPGRMALWTRLTGTMARTPTPTTPAVLGFLADMVPLAICKAAGVAGAGTSLDNSLRIGEPRDAEWVLLELDADVAVGGVGHGTVRLWSDDGHLLATGSQSARLFTIDDFINRRAG